MTRRAEIEDMSLEDAARLIRFIESYGDILAVLEGATQISASLLEEPSWGAGQERRQLEAKARAILDHIEGKKGAA